MKCKNCGNEIEKGEKYCGTCGTEIVWEDIMEQKDDDMLKNTVSNDAGMNHQENNASSDPTKKLVIRSFWKYILFGVLTCGIYDFYVLWHITKDINTVCEGDGKRSPNYLVVLLLSIVTLGIYGYYWYYTQGKRLYESAPAYNVHNDKNGMFYLLWILFLPSIGGLVVVYFLLKNLNLCINVHNSGFVAKTADRRTQKASAPQKVLFGVAIFLRCAVIIGTFVLIGAIGLVGNDGAANSEYEFEIGELSEILDTEEEELYYEDTLHVHGFLYRHPADGRYFLTDPSGEEAGVMFTYDGLSDDIGDGSELIVTGVLGYNEDAPSLTILLGSDVEVIEKVERVYTVDSLNELIEGSSEYIGKRVCVFGSVEGVGDSVWITDYDDTEVHINLAGKIMDIPYDAVEDWNAAYVTGVFTLDEYGEAVIEVENVE